MDGKPAQILTLGAPESAQEIARIRASDQLGSSGRLRDLFDFLIERSLLDDPPKEIEIIEAVFSKSGRVAPEDSVARVYVHRLRKRLDEISAKGGSDHGIRLHIPRGEYRVVAERVPVKDAIQGERANAARLIEWLAVATRPRARTLGVAGALALLLVGNVVAWSRLASGVHNEASVDFAKFSVWAPMAKSQSPLLIVVGDYYMFGEYKDRLFLTRLIRDFSINSKEDLVDRYLTSPAAFDRYGDVALQYLPASAAFALADLAPVLARRDVRVTLASELTDSQLKENDIIYVGLLSGLGKLKEPVFATSRFAIGESYDDLRDTATGKTYTSEAFLAAPSDSMYRDYGLFKSFRGPAGRQIVVLAGARDTALMGVSEALTRGHSLAGLEIATGAISDVETLFEIQGRKHVNLEARMLVWSEVDSAKIWSSSPGDMPVFPSQ